MDGVANTKLLNAGAIGSAIAASICCLGPLALALLGLGAGTLLLRFEPYRPYFLVATALFLGAAFHLTYHRAAPEECEPGPVCARSSTTRKGQKIALWIVTVIVVLAAAFPYFSGTLF